MSTNAFIWIAIAFLVIVLCIELIRKNKQSPVIPDRSSEVAQADNGLIPVSPVGKAIDRLFEFTQIDGLIDTRTMTEIKDPSLLSRIDAVIPGTAQAVTNSALVSNHVNTLKSATPVYRVIIPEGEELVKSRTMKDAFRGFTRKNNKIAHQANLVEVKYPAENGLAVAASVEAAMSVASIVVGQYYMTQINGKLEKVSETLDKVEKFQKNEFKSKIKALIVNVRNVATFQYEVLQNDELRNRMLIHLKDLETTCSELLGQTNSQLTDIAQRVNKGFEQYNEDVYEANTWLRYQQILLNLLGRIAELTYALNLGAVSREYAFSSMKIYTIETEEVLAALRKWHLDSIDAHGVNIQKNTIKRHGLDKVLFAIPAAFKEELKFKGISEKTTRMILDQLNASAEIPSITGPDQFKQRVQLIAKDGRLYYLPNADRESQIDSLRSVPD